MVTQEFHCFLNDSSLLSNTRRVCNSRREPNVHKQTTADKTGNANKTKNSKQVTKVGRLEASGRLGSVSRAIFGGVPRSEGGSTLRYRSVISRSNPLEILIISTGLSERHAFNPDAGYYVRASRCARNGMKEPDVGAGTRSSAAASPLSSGGFLLKKCKKFALCFR